MALDDDGIASSVREELGSGLRGEVVCPGDRGYDAARAVFNGMIDRRPLAVIRSVDASDVVRCITFARRHDLPLSVRGGGHSVAGNAVRDGAVMLDLSGMKALRVDPATRTVRAEPGLTLGEFDRATQAFGLATTLGVVSTTGIAGLTLGGGLGWLNGRHGLACDNLISADVATADGQLLRVSAQENEDLFWSIRGGGTAASRRHWRVSKLYNTRRQRPKCLACGYRQVGKTHELVLRQRAEDSEGSAIRDRRDTMLLTTCMFIPVGAHEGPGSGIDQAEPFDQYAGQVRR
jgi:hypothetical protein